MGNSGTAGTLFRWLEAYWLQYQGEWEESSQRLRTLQTDTRQHKDPQSLWFVSTSLGEILLETGSLAEAEPVLAEAIEISERLGFGVSVHALLSAVYARQGRITAAHQLLAEAREKVGHYPTPRENFSLPLAEARVAMCEGAWTKAIGEFAAAAKLAAQIGIRWYHAQTLREWAEAHLARNEQGDHERAHALLQEALAEFEAMGVAKYAEMVRERLQQLKG